MTTAIPTDSLATGLTDAQVAAVRAEVGANTIPEAARPKPWTRVVAQLRDPMILLLLAAAALAMVLGDLTDTAVIALVVVLNTAVGVAQELRAERSLAALRDLSAPTARLVRNGHRVVLHAAEVVPGDVLVLEAGDIVAADAVLRDGHHLQVDEAALTGESVPVDKRAGVADVDLVYAGTVVTRGRGLCEVTQTGARSSLGRIATLLGEQRPRPTPLQRRLSGLGRVLALAAIALSGVVAVSGLLRGESLAEMALVGISLAVAAVPESLPAVVTLALALGAHRMAKRGGVVRSLPAVETLGSVTVLAADKTGTLTEGRMLVERLWTPECGEAAVTGAGYEPVGEISPDTGLARLLRDGALCNDADIARPDEEGGIWRAVGDPTEAALVVLAAKGGVDSAALGERYPRVAEIPFDHDSKRMTTVHRAPDGWLVVCKGAPEVLLDTPGLLCEVPAHARETAMSLARKGYRVLAVAERTYPEGPRPNADAEGLALVGLVAIIDPPRESAAEVVATFRRAGVRLLLITGDHPHTAHALAARVGIDADGVYARTRPEQKLDIVAELQARGEVVAMTGDGVNDAPALRRADIGTAMGGEGTEVARQAADLVLTDDNLGTVAAAIEEGRRIYANVRTFLRYALAGGVAEVVVMLLGPLFGLALPLLPAQILWINMLTHGLPGVAMGAEPADPAIMRARPRPPQQFILGDGLWRRIAWTGALIAAVTLGVGVWASATGRPWQSLIFLTLGLAQLGVALAVRTRGTGLRPRFLDIAVAGAVLLQLGGVYLAPLRALLGTEPVGLTDLAIVAGIALLPGLAVLAARLGSRST
ncbi:cation-translocating P-type ATPase [Actinokineospora xionganensis]|uniref:Cation-transporting P-type ATPase n=1 Tax=Actinokineospora xionganensis TaxID=2684470 RepID=A0ABR7KZH2_9PSEU|nr:cation-transporting P-type ATPase [Actinokineospora xionganensis]MBC6445831.1 cation-transporting P-type ATPase [Actinokineospora xionganensis]